MSIGAQGTADSLLVSSPKHTRSLMSDTELLFRNQRPYPFRAVRQIQLFPLDFMSHCIPGPKAETAIGYRLKPGGEERQRSPAPREREGPLLRFLTKHSGSRPHERVQLNSVWQCQQPPMREGRPEHRRRGASRDPRSTPVRRKPRRAPPCSHACTLGFTFRSLLVNDGCSQRGLLV